MILHTINKSPFQCNTLASCLEVAAKGSAILLIEEGVYGATTTAPVRGDLEHAREFIHIYALTPDIEARGLADHIVDWITLVDYDRFVQLTTQHHCVQSWL